MTFRRWNPALLLLVVLVGLGACRHARKEADRDGPHDPGLDLAALDKSVKPGDDFYAFANGTWLKTTEIPPERAAYGTESVIEERTEQRTADLIADADDAHAKPGSDARKVGDFFASYMDEPGIEAKGLAPLAPRLGQIAAISNPKELAQALGRTLRADVDVLNNTNVHTPHLFGLWVAQDLQDPTRYAPFLLQGGLGLPDRDFYLAPSPRMETIRREYRAHIAALFELAGISDAAKKAARVFALEKAIAQVHASRVQSEDVRSGYNPWTPAQLARRAPGLDWPAFLDATGLSGQPRLIVWQPRAVTGISALVASQPLAAWKEFLAFHALEEDADLLPKAFVDAQFAFHGKVLQGTPRIRPRWKRALAATDAAVGEIVGKLYVARYFSPEEKARAEQMVRNILAAFGRRIDALDWMAPQTKKMAKAKLASLKVGVGYPDQWRDYSGLEVIRGDALGNVERAREFEYRRNLAKLGKSVDRGEWVMNPQLVNAVNLPAMNALNFPAAGLQPPDFDPDRPVVMDYGAAGSVIGHEISHSFDSQGALFDAEGRLRNWWTKEDVAHFAASSARLVKQYDRYKPFPDLHINGKLTLNENIADVAGLAAAYDAYRIAEGGKEAATVQGLTGDQQFFLSFAQSWRLKMREPAARELIVTDGHALSEYRADTVRNLDAWYAAFGVQRGEALYLAPRERVRVW